VVNRREEIKAALIGECMIELQETEPGRTSQSFGGDTLNAAVYMARMNRYVPLHVDYVTALGKDIFSDRMMAFWEAEGVGSDLVLRRQGQLPGLYYIQLDENGERSFSYWRGEAAAKKCFEGEGSDALLEKLGDFNLIYLSGISIAVLTTCSRSRLFDKLKELVGTGCKICFDYNYRPNLWREKAEMVEAYSEIISLCDTVFVGLDELAEIHGVKGREEGHGFLAGKGVAESVIRSGAKRCTVMAGDDVYEIAALKVDNVVDTTAAGDSFSGGYLAARLGGCDVVAAAQAAHQMAAYVIGYKGAIAPLEKMPDFSSFFA